MRKKGIKINIKKQLAFEEGEHSGEKTDVFNLGWYWSENKEKFLLAKVDEKARAAHFYVVGATGAGKTKFLEYLIQQDIRKGNGVGVIDPHGDLIEDIKGFLALYFGGHEGDEELSKRIILIDPTDPDYSVAFNPLEKLPNISIAEQAGELVSAFKKIWLDSWGARMEEMLMNSCIALAENNLTLAELPLLLTDYNFRANIKLTIKNPITRQYFRTFETWSPKMKAFWTESTLNKINAFLVDERMRQMLTSEKSSFNFREIIDNKKILLVKLDKGRLKDSAELLGSLIMAKIQMAAFSRSDIPLKNRIPFYLYIDEFQNFASESFTVFMSEARKFKVPLIMAHQVLDQVPAELRSLILGNTGIQVYFRLNRKDSQILAKEVFKYEGDEVKTMSNFHPVFWSLGEEWEHHIEELQSLPFRSCYVKHKIEGGVIPIQTVEIESSQEVLGLDDERYLEFIKSLPFGKKYLVKRSTLDTLMEQRQNRIIPKKKPRGKFTKKIKRIPIPPQVYKEKQESFVKKEPDIPYEKIEQRPELSAPEIKDESQHRYLQTLIKRLAEENGYKAIIEQPTQDNLGRVDVGLEKNRKKVAIEISITSTADQELNNLEKCLKAGYEKVILCSPDKKTLESVKTLVSQKLKESEQKRILYFDPEGLILYFEEEFTAETSKEERVKGYKVKVKYKTVHESERKTKREAVAQVILQALKRMKDKK